MSSEKRTERLSVMEMRAPGVSSPAIHIKPEPFSVLSSFAALPTVDLYPLSFTIGSDSRTQ